MIITGGLGKCSIAGGFGKCSIARGLGKCSICTIGRTKCIHAQGEDWFAIYIHSSKGDDKWLLLYWSYFSWPYSKSFDFKNPPSATTKYQSPKRDPEHVMHEWNLRAHFMQRWGDFSTESALAWTLQLDPDAQRTRMPSRNIELNLSLSIPTSAAVRTRTSGKVGKTGGSLDNMMWLITTWTKHVYVCFYVSLELASVFLLARFGRKTDGHIVYWRMLFKFLMYFFCL